MKQLDRSEASRAQLVNLAKPKTRDDRLIVAEFSDVNKNLALKAKEWRPKAKTKTKDLDFGRKDQGQCQGLTSLLITDQVS